MFVSASMQMLETKIPHLIMFCLVHLLQNTYRGMYVSKTFKSGKHNQKTFGIISRI